MYRLINQILNTNFISISFMTTVSAISVHYLSHERHRKTGDRQMVANHHRIRSQFMVLRSTLLTNESQDKSQAINDIHERVFNSTVKIITDKFVDTNVCLGGTHTGTGFTIGQPGYILTNYHVVSGMFQCNIERCYKDDQGNIDDEYDVYWNAPPGKVVYVDPSLDLALIWTFPTERHLALDLEVMVQIGEPVVSLGNPLGINYSICDGIVTDLGRNERHLCEISYKYAPICERQLYHNCPTVAGFSGGPLVNMNGQVIGINWGSHETFKVGTAIPASIIANFIEKGLQYEKDYSQCLYRNSKSLGIVIKPNDPYLLRGLSVCETIDATSTTDDNQIQRYDVILEVNGNAINSVNDLKVCLNACNENEELSVRVTRNFEFNDRILKVKPKSIKVSVI